MRKPHPAGRRDAVPYVTRIYKEAIEGVAPETREKILQKYKKTAKPGESVAAIMDETNAYYAEQVLGNKYTLEKLILQISSLLCRLMLIILLLTVRSFRHRRYPLSVRSE